MNAARPRRHVALAALALLAAAPASAAGEEPLSRIALGSCARQNKPQPIWFSVVDYHPDLFLFIGDNIYGDTEDMGVLKQKYAQLGSKPGFQKLRATCPLLAVWDDHDYGVNDGGREYPKREASQRVFNDFFHVPQDSPRRERPGIYDAHVFGPEGKRVQVILLDTRYFRSPLATWPKDDRRTPGPYRPDDDPRATMLGEAQWKWLEEQLRVPAELRILASSIQVIPEQHGWEMWANFPRERQRLFDLIEKTGAQGVMFISGDRHMAEISRAAPQYTGVGYPLYDLTSSSLNQPSSGDQSEKNRHRVGELYRPVNFGTITIDWQRNDPPIRLAVHGADGNVVREHAFHLSELHPRN